MRADRRKMYPLGTRASVEIDAETDEPQTKRRGREFQETVRDVMLEARVMLDQRLAERGFTAKVKIVDMDCEAWFPDDAVEYRS